MAEHDRNPDRFPFHEVVLNALEFLGVAVFVALVLLLSVTLGVVRMAHPIRRTMSKSSAKKTLADLSTPSTREPCAEALPTLQHTLNMTENHDGDVLAAARPAVQRRCGIVGTSA
jgi:hypothetical protein